MPHLTADSARSFDLHGVTFHSFAASASGATRLAAWRADVAPGTPGQAHTMTEEETLYVLAGTLAVRIDDEEFEANAGDAVLVPAGSRFSLSNTTDEPARLWVNTLLGMKARMDANGDLIAPPWAQ